ncbi:hypothetical protein D3C78_1734060 [compost metagenome]
MHLNRINAVLHRNDQGFFAVLLRHLVPGVIHPEVAYAILPDDLQGRLAIDETSPEAVLFDLSFEFHIEGTMESVRK